MPYTYTPNDLLQTRNVLTLLQTRFLTSAPLLIPCRLVTFTPCAHLTPNTSHCCLVHTWHNLLQTPHILVFWTSTDLLQTPNVIFTQLVPAKPRGVRVAGDAGEGRGSKWRYAVCPIRSLPEPASRHHGSWLAVHGSAHAAPLFLRPMGGVQWVNGRLLPW